MIVSSLLLLAGIDGVVDSKNVLRVKILLGLNHELNGELRVCLVEELLSLLTNSVMMRDASTVLN